jgi:uncharacterized protein
MLVFIFRKKKPLILVWMGFGFFIVPLIINALFSFSIPYWPEESYASTLHSWQPDADALAHELEAMRGSWPERMAIRLPAARFMQTGYFLMASFWRITSMMLLGMALFKWNVLTAQRSNSFYLRMILVGLVTGFALSGLGMVLNFRNGWTMEYSMFRGNQFNYIGSLGVALGYIGLLMRWARTDLFQGVKAHFASVGRMAFTNYMLMTLIAVLVFNGGGLALYGKVERNMQVVWVLGIWVLLLLLSHLWLKRYRFGPLEAIWRSLTYWKGQALKQNNNYRRSN